MSDKYVYVEKTEGRLYLVPDETESAPQKTQSDDMSVGAYVLCAFAAVIGYALVVKYWPFFLLIGVAFVGYFVLKNIND